VMGKSTKNSPVSKRSGVKKESYPYITVYKYIKLLA